MIPMPEEREEMYPTDFNPIFSLQFMISMPDEVEEMYPANLNNILPRAIYDPDAGGVEGK